MGSVSASLVIVGNEVLSGRTQDRNLAYLAGRLNEVGVRLMEVRVIPDVAETISHTVKAMSEEYDYVFTTGGIGPTHDDITADSVAAAFDVPIGVDPEARRRLEAHYRTTGLELNAARLRMARIPEGAQLIDNPISAAPGFRIRNVYVMAGVPKIMAAMVEGILPELKGGRPLGQVSVRSALAEGNAAEGLSALTARFPEVEFGSYPAWTSTGYALTIVARSDDEAVLEEAAGAVETLVRDLGEEPERIL